MCTLETLPRFSLVHLIFVYISITWNWWIWCFMVQTFLINFVIVIITFTKIICQLHTVNEIQARRWKKKMVSSDSPSLQKESKKKGSFLLLRCFYHTPIFRWVKTSTLHLKKNHSVVLLFWFHRNQRNKALYGH